MIGTFLQCLMMASGVALVIGVYVWTHSWIYNRAQAQLETWAASHGARIVDCEMRWFRQGPFFWRSTNSQFVYRVIVEDATGARRGAYVRVGGWFLGAITHHVEACWDK